MIRSTSCQDLTKKPWIKATFQGETLATSNRYETIEGDFYFPKEDVNFSFFHESPGVRQSQWKGESRYYDLKVRGRFLRHGAFYYPEPLQAAMIIKGLIGFDRKRGIKIEPLKLNIVESEKALDFSGLKTVEIRPESPPAINPITEGPSSADFETLSFQKNDDKEEF